MIGAYAEFVLDDALVRFNNLMLMDTFSLIDDETQCGLRDDLSFYEMYKTRLLRVDQEQRSRRDPLQNWLHKFLRRMRYRRMCRNLQDPEKQKAGTFSAGKPQNTVLIGTIVCRIAVALMTAVFLAVPLAALAGIAQRGTQIAVISACIIVFATVVSLLLKTSNLELMIASATYAAILSVFVSNGPTPA